MTIMRQITPRAERAAPRMSRWLRSLVVWTAAERGVAEWFPGLNWVG